MEYLCQTCDEFFYDEYSINNPNLNDIDKIINNYVTSYNKKFDIFYIKCDFYSVFNNDFGIHIKTHYVHSKNESTKMQNYYSSSNFSNLKDIVFVTLMKLSLKPLLINTG